MSYPLKEVTIDNACGTTDHYFIHLKSLDPKEIRYRKWAQVEQFFCRKCLAIKTIEIPIEETSRYPY